MEQIDVSGMFETPFEALSVLKLDSLMNLREILWKRLSPQGIFPRLTHLQIVNCPQIQNIYWATYLPCLEYVDVSFCYNLKQAFRSRMHDENTKASMGTLPCLRLLYSGNNTEFANTEFANLCDSHVTMQNLPPKLRTLEFGTVTEWNRLEWEDQGVKSYLQPFLKFRFKEY